MLAPFDIAKLLEATRSTLSHWERGRHMDVIDDIFSDTSQLSRDGPLRIFGSDLSLMEQRIKNPCQFLKEYGAEYNFHIFIVGYHEPKVQPHSIRFRSTSSPSYAPHTYPLWNMPQSFTWNPYFKSRPNVSIRSYFADPNCPVLYISRPLISRVFGYQDPRAILLNLSDLFTPCMLLKNGMREVSRKKGELTMGFIMEKLASARRNIVVACCVYPLDAAITVEL